MASVIATGFSAVTVDQASAQNFLQRLFNPEQQRRDQERLRQEELRQQASKVKVSAPRYLNYSPDSWKRVSLEELSEKKTAEVQPGAALESADTDVPATQADTAPETPVVLTAFDEARPALKGMSLTVLPEVGEALIAFYREHPDFLWLDDGKATVKAAQLRRELANAAVYALNPDDYFVVLPATAGLEGAERDAALMRFEMELSAAALTYVLDAKRGRVDPNRISQYHDLPRHEVDLVAALEELNGSDDAAAELAAQQPQNDHFKKLSAELARLKAEDQEADQVVIAPGTFLKPGKSSPEMKNVVAAVAKNGSEELKSAHAETLEAYDDGEIYTPELVALVKAFQKEAKLTPDGIVGKNTINAMVGETNAAKIAKVELAMERSRWLPEVLGERKVFINQAAFTATYFAPDEVPLQMRVVVGKKSNQTNFFYDKIEIVEYNPYWGVPYSIIVNEMLPKLANDPSYLDRAGYEVSTAGGRKVSSASVNWYAVASKQQTINVRQYPGQSNALGEVKILFPNKHHIYMHDTPAKNLFKKDMRAFSHGCIRLHDPKAMAAAVLGKSKDYVTSRIAQGQNEQEQVSGDIPVYVSYFTAWPDLDGTVAFYSDVYDRDRYLLQALEKTEAVRAKARTS
ncbi:L,D-transpeptidase family protein [Roseibium sediminicola]|uniref:L,D-transpeptidase family protein n=1 Tax=Roseibium sediminicola TaxID=2933272 RepID=A0ABT0GRQ3_9HYPH|nr:L,D-transpeptidase family protein [Roseibium sp. CAU 1639]MCK7611488.1 L,D-transpeptidase family protein [Roseibium sp. CAU 1639]